MKSSAHALGGEHRDRMRPQMRVKRVADGVGLPVFGEIECATCPSACTPASVRPAPCTSVFSPDSASIAAVSRPARWAVRLALPADERRAVIFDDEFVARHLAHPRAGFDRRAAQEFLRRSSAACRRAGPARAAPRRSRKRSSVGRRAPCRARPLPFALVERSALTRTPAISNQAPGNGDRPRMWSCTSFQGFAQSIRVSSLSIFVGVGDAGVRLRREVERPRSSAASARAIRSAPSRASASCKSPAVMSGADRRCARPTPWRRCRGPRPSA